MKQLSLDKDIVVFLNVSSKSFLFFIIEIYINTAFFFTKRNLGKKNKFKKEKKRV